MKNNITTNLVTGFDGLSPKLKHLLNYDNVSRRINQRDEIVSLVQKLSCILPMDVQEKAISTLICILGENDYDLLIIAGHKYTWLNTIKILSMAKYPKNQKALPSLLLLFQDLNWPGAIEGMHVLIKADKNILIPMIETAIESAFNSEDYMWLAGLKYFVEFAQITKDDFNEHNIHKMLEYAKW